MEGMKEFPDKHFDLAIVDPPYGISRDGGETGKYWKWYEPKTWDRKIPDEQYWSELYRISCEQIIWGANYFTKYLSASMGWIFWDKGQELTMSDGELAFTSFDRALRKVKINRCKIAENGDIRIHPTQKPVYLYRWLLQNYAQSGWKILDTHVGSASSLIACEWEGFDYVGFELDPDYYAAATKRLELWRKSRTLELFEREEVMPK
jgi:site-specific DNA-methyltransferase (adenine-specific)